MQVRWSIETYRNKLKLKWNLWVSGTSSWFCFQTQGQELLKETWHFSKVFEVTGEGTAESEGVMGWVEKKKPLGQGSVLVLKMSSAVISTRHINILVIV